MASASRSGLRFVDDSLPGITRRLLKRGFAYFAADGSRITDPAELERLRKVGLPPAYRECWYCPDANGHIQATGRDARGRKQYRYHVDFRAAREEDKFGSCPAFGKALPTMRARVDAALRARTPSRERALAAIVRLLDVGMIRIGNERYTAENGSFGAATLRMRHVRPTSAGLRLRFKAKSGKLRDMTVRDVGLLRFVRAMQDLPGQRLFQYLDDAGEAHEIGSSEINAYIRETMGEGFSAKHFRTWGGTLTAWNFLLAADDAPGLKPMLAVVADALGNTPAISRKSYIHPRVLALAREPDFSAWRARVKLPRGAKWLSRAERGLISFLGD